MSKGFCSINLFAAMCLCIMAAFSSCISDDDPENTGITVGDPLPSFSASLSDGSVVTTASLQGRVAVIEFFNTGCSDCRRSFPVLQELYDEYKDNPQVKIFAIAREEEEPAIAAYWTENRLTIPFSPQSDRALYSLFATVGIPRLYIANPAGTIIAAYGPDSLPSPSRLSSLITSHLPPGSKAAAPPSGSEAARSSSPGSEAAALAASASEAAWPCQAPCAGSARPGE